MISLPQNFRDHISSNATELCPVILIETLSEGIENKAGVIISTRAVDVKVLVDVGGSNVDYEPVFLDKIPTPILLDYPSLNETIDTQTRRYKISNVNLNISNSLYNGKRFSDLFNNYINLKVRIYWVAPNSNKLVFHDLHKTGYYSGMEELKLDADYTSEYHIADKAVQVFTGQVVKYTKNQDRVNLIIEDKTQTILHKDLPTANVGSGEDVPPDYKNKPFPMVYGEVRQSPLVLKRTAPTSDFGVNKGILEMWADKDGRINIVEGYHGGLVMYEGTNIVHVLQEIGEWPEERFNYRAGTIQYKTDIASNRFVLVPAGAGHFAWDELDADNDRHGNPHTNQQLVCAEFRKIQYGVEQTESEVIPLRVRSEHLSDKSNVGHAYYTTLLSPDGDLYGTLVRDRGQDGYSPWNGESLLYRIENETGGDDSGYGRVEDWRGMHPSDDNMALVGCLIKTNLSSGHIANNTKLRWSISLSVDGNFSVSSQHGYCNNGTSVKIRFGTEKGKTDENLGISKWTEEDRVDCSELSGYTENQWTDIVAYNVSGNFANSESDAPTEIWTKDADTLLISAEAVSGRGQTVGASYNNIGKGAGRLRLNEIDIQNYMLYDNIMEKKYFGYIRGRLGIDCTMPEILQDIMYEEFQLLHHDDYESSEYSNWTYDFTVNETINAKDLLEELSSASPYIPRFNNLGRFKIDTIPKSGGTPAFSVSSNDVIDFKFSLTDPKDVKTKIVFNYKWDYAREEFTEKKEVSIGNFEDSGFLSNYDGSVYGFKNYSKVSEKLEGNISDTTLVIDDERGKYIRDEGTASYYCAWLLSYHCNTRLKMELELPLSSAIQAEAGDIFNIEGDLILGIKPYGIDYTTGNFINGNQFAYKNFMIIGVKKSIDSVRITAIQMHQLFSYDGSDGAVVQGCMDSNACNYNPDATVAGECFVDDCLGVCGGNAVIDNCGVCDGQNIDCDIDCFGVANGTGVLDCAGNCYDIFDTPPYSEGICGCLPTGTENQQILCCNQEMICGTDDSLCDECGCTDPNAMNYDESATADDGSCLYPDLLDYCANPTSNLYICNYLPDYCDNGIITGLTEAGIDPSNEILDSEILNQTGANSLYVINPNSVPTGLGGDFSAFWDAFINQISEQYDEWLLNESPNVPALIGINENCYVDGGGDNHLKGDLQYFKLTSNDAGLNAQIFGENENFIAQSLNVLGINAEEDVVKTNIQWSILKPEMVLDGTTTIKQFQIAISLDNLTYGLADANINFGAVLVDPYEITEQGDACIMNNSCVQNPETNQLGDWYHMQTTDIVDGGDSYSFERELYLFMFDDNIDFNQPLNFDLRIDLKIKYENDVSHTYNLNDLNITILDCPKLGDVNGDGFWDILDIATLGNCVLNGNCTDTPSIACAGDLNQDGYYNVSDILKIAQCIAEQNCDDLGCNCEIGVFNGVIKGDMDNDADENADYSPDLEDLALFEQCSGISTPSNNNPNYDPIQITPEQTCWDLYPDGRWDLCGNGHLMCAYLALRNCVWFGDCPDTGSGYHWYINNEGQQVLSHYNDAEEGWTLNPYVGPTDYIGFGWGRTLSGTVCAEELFESGVEIDNSEILIGNTCEDV